ncbi:uncharacterized protein BJX67DRAFT_374565 [Aspergillus lucknowensis]|uniref:Uncharacterized protein n=1 Tax=Aspergillus lucknowensis TaxID=176173 RepID=A0ABR4LFN8_9EURO
MERALAYRAHRLEIFRLYVVERRTRPQAKAEFESRVTSEPHLTQDQWNRLLYNMRIIKSLKEDEVVILYPILAATPGHKYRLIFAGDVLQNNEKIEERWKRIDDAVKANPKVSDRRLYYSLCVDVNLTAALHDPDAFRNFQHLLFTTRVHFESSFSHGTWALNHQGLYARTTELRQQLTDLSRFHNTISHALNEMNGIKPERGRALWETASTMHRTIVQNSHHRQFPDIVGILLVAWRDGNEQLQQSIRDDLVRLARTTLAENEPRRIMFECLERLDLTQIAPLYIAYDSYCRALWMSKVQGDPVKAYYSYNQASFPRAEAGQFYSLFQGMDLRGIQVILDRMEMELGPLTHEALCEMDCITRQLCDRVDRLGMDFDYNQDRQLNLDAAMTFILFGDSRNEQGFVADAREAFNRAVQLRNQIVPEDVWDAARAAALNNLVELDTRLGSVLTADASAASIDRMYPGI